MLQRWLHLCNCFMSLNGTIFKLANCRIRMCGKNALHQSSTAASVMTLAWLVQQLRNLHVVPSRSTLLMWQYGTEMLNRWEEMLEVGEKGGRTRQKIQIIAAKSTVKQMATTMIRHFTSNSPFFFDAAWGGVCGASVTASGIFTGKTGESDNSRLYCKQKSVVSRWACP